MQLGNGYYQLPPGKLASAVAWMELTELSPKAAAPAPAGLSLRRLWAADAALHRSLYRSVGEPWLWSGMIDKTEEAIADHLAHADVLSYALLSADRPIGLLELVASPQEGIEIVYFGLQPGEGGKGAGAWMMGETIRLAREGGHKRLWLHTCSFDHPRAVEFYRRFGFRVYAQGLEIMDDPRRSGLLPTTSAPHVPMLEG